MTKRYTKNNKNNGNTSSTSLRISRKKRDSFKDKDNNVRTMKTEEEVVVTRNKSKMVMNGKSYGKKLV